MADVKVSQEQVEEQFRDALKDLVTIGEKLAPWCRTTAELVDVAKLAVDNDGQLRMLLAMTTSGKK